MSVSSRTRKRKFFVDNSDEQRFLFENLSENRNVVMKALARKFDEAFYDAHHLDIPSVSTVNKAVIRKKWTQKVVTRVHIRKDPELQNEYMDNIAQQCSCRSKIRSMWMA